MSLLLGAVTIGLILGLLALGVHLSFRIFHFPDITAEGSITLGAATASILLVNGWNPWLATGLAFFAGAAAGAVTGVLHTRFKINGLLAGILVMTALYSVNLHVMGKSNLPLLSTVTLLTYCENFGTWICGGAESISVFGWPVSSGDAGALICSLIMISVVAAVLHGFYRTELGTSLRATGDNPQMIRALGVDVEGRITLGLSLSNGLVALAGALLAQYQGFADVQMGIGMLVWGLASVIIGEALIGAAGLGLLITGAIMGSVLFRLLVAIALRWGLNPNDLKFITAVFVFSALVLPGLIAKLKRRKEAPDA